METVPVIVRALGRIREGMDQKDRSKRSSSLERRIYREDFCP